MAGPTRQLVVFVTGSFYFRYTGWVNAPLPAESQAAKRIHFFPAGSKGIRNLCVPNGGRLVALMIWRPPFQTSSTNSRGKVHSISAVAAVLSRDQLRKRTSPVETK